MIIIGAKKYDFKDNETGRQIKGFSCYGLHNTNNPNIVGYDVEKFSLSEEMFFKLRIDELIKNQKSVTPIYNRYGKVESVYVDEA